MASLPNGNFRIRAVLGWNEIDGRGAALRALVKRRRQGVLRGGWAWSGSDHRRAAGECKPQTQGWMLGRMPKTRESHLAS